MPIGTGMSTRIRLPRGRSSPLRSLLLRLAAATAVLLVMFLIVVFDRGGYTDNADGQVSVLDALYYTTVSISTTGYGDVVPVSTAARLITSLVITPLRVIFLGILVASAFEVLTQRTRDDFRVHRWKERTRMHTVVIGYGTKGRAAIATLVASGTPQDQFIVVDKHNDQIGRASCRERV